MSLIKKINLEQTIDYSKNNLEYFYRAGSTSTLSDYQRITDKIRVAEKSVKIATTNEISNEIYDALHQNNDLNVYIIFKSFEKSTNSLSKFDSKKPIVAREVQELDNNFIIVDDVSFLLVNPLSQKENIYLEFNDNKTQDLNFIFNYLFWNCSTLEKLIDKISQPVESPFPPFDNRKLDYINLTHENLNNVETIFIPRDKKFSNELNNEVTIRNFSDDINVPIYVTHEYTQVGCIRIKNMSFAIKNFWELKRNTLSEIPTHVDIIPREDNWLKTIKITESSGVTLKDITAQTIDEMEEVKPATFPEERYIKTVSFKWEVLPPTKPMNIKKSTLYAEYYNLSHDFKQKVVLLESKLKALKQETSILSSFLGMNKNVDKNIAKLVDYKKLKLEEEKPNELRELLTNEFESFYREVFKSEADFKFQKQKNKEEQGWEQRKKNKLFDLNKMKGEIDDIESSVESKNDHKKQDRLKRLHKNLSMLQQEINDNFTKFSYKPKNTNEMSHFKKNKPHEYKPFTIPLYALPEVGALYEASDCYYLEIINYEQLDKAKELERRYNNKNYKIVVGEGNE
jgi:hypothetical protein